MVAIATDCSKVRPVKTFDSSAPKKKGVVNTDFETFMLYIGFNLSFVSLA